MGDDVVRDERVLLSFRLSLEESEAVRAAARAEDRTLAAWLRRAVLAALPTRQQGGAA